RHESLRTVFPEHDGRPYQRILPLDRIRLPFLREDVAESELSARLAVASSTPFNLSEEIPLRAWLFRLAATKHVLLLLVHHIACDGWSMGPLGKDLAAAYSARLAGSAPEWRPLDIQYADYALWQRRFLGEHSDPNSPLRQQLSYWRTALGGI